MHPKWYFLRQAAMMVPADQMANPLQHTALSDAELLMREAIQNSADERRPEATGPVRFSVRRKQLADKRLAAGFHLGGSVGIDHIAVIFAQLVMHVFGSMTQKVAVLVHGAALNGKVIC